MAAIEGKPIDDLDISPYLDTSTEQFRQMVEWIRRDVNKETEIEVVTRIIYLTTQQTVSAIGLPEDRVCTYCWTGKV
jgi:amidophosphoribosyltransferase